MAFTATDGGEEPPPAAPQTAGELHITGRQQNRTKHVHQDQTTSPPTSQEIHNVLVSTETPFKSISSSTNHPIPDRQKKALKTRKNNKSSPRFLVLHRSESETVFSATPGTPFQSIVSSSSHRSSDRSEKLSKTEKKVKSNARFSSPNKSETEAAILLTGNGDGQQLHPTEHQPFSDLPPSPSRSSVNEQLQPESRHDSSKTAANVHGLAEANLLPNLAPPSPVVTGTKDTSLLSATARSDVFTIAASVNGHDGASSSAGAAESAANVLESLPAMMPTAAKHNTFPTTHHMFPIPTNSKKFKKPTHYHLSPTHTNFKNINKSTHYHLSPTHKFKNINKSTHYHLSPTLINSKNPNITHSASTQTLSSLHPSHYVVPTTNTQSHALSPTHTHSKALNKTNSTSHQTPFTLHPPHFSVPATNSPLLNQTLCPTIHHLSPTQITNQIPTNPCNGTPPLNHSNHSADHITTTQTQTLDPSTQTQTQTQTQQPNTQTQSQQPKTQHPAHNLIQNISHTQTFTKTSFNPSKESYASIINPVPLLNPNGPSHPQKSFSDVVSGQKDSTIPLKPVSLMQGEPAVIFSTEEIAAMAEPFKLALIGKFSFGRPSMDIIRKFFNSLGLKGTSQISLLDNRHILIKLSLEEDYSRIWVRQSWYVNGRGMRIFKWSKDFRCSVESPVVPVWVSLPHLPVHFIYCKAALYSIATAIGTPLRVDNATASGNRPSVARILVEYDISQPLLPRIWIGEGDSGFWQDVIFEKVPAYCSSCRHLGHSSEACYIANPGLRKAPQSTPPSQRPAADKSEQPAASADEHPRQVPTTQHTVISDLQHLGVMGISSHPLHREGMHTASVMPQDAHVDDIRPLGPPALRDIPHAPDMTPEPLSLAIQIVGFNTHCTDFPSSEEIGDDGETGDGVQTRDGTETRDGEEISDDAIIKNFGDQRIIRCSEGFIEVTPRKNFKIKQRRQR